MLLNQGKLTKENSSSPHSNKISDDIHIGKDILELLSHAMYLSPLTIYREYVQNSADSIEEAEARGFYKKNVKPRIDIKVDLSERSIKIRDNGAGISKINFEKRITAFGGSKKRGLNARGFRGVGRLAGLGYCQELIFRTKANEEKTISEIRWDCRRLLECLRDDSFTGDLKNAVYDVTSISNYPAKECPDHFFEVELRKVVRIKNDVLLNENEIEFYLSQIAPVPFSPSFKFCKKIEDYLSKFNLGKSFEIYLNNNQHPIYRPHRNSFRLSDSLIDHFNDIRFFEIPNHNNDESFAAVGWTLEHSYYGAIPDQEGVKGLRLRAGNIQVGSTNIVSEAFQEKRFNSWAVGEVHVLSKHILPNGRRDNFIQNTHFLNFLSHISLQTHTISKACRTKSISRNRTKCFESECRKVHENLSLIEQSAIPKTLVSNLKKEIGSAIGEMRKTANSKDLFEEEARDLKNELQKLETLVEKTINNSFIGDPLERLPQNKKNIYREVFGLIYECAPNKIVAKSLVDKILCKISLID